MDAVEWTIATLLVLIVIIVAFVVVGNAVANYEYKSACIDNGYTNIVTINEDVYCWRIEDGFPALAEVPVK